MARMPALFVGHGSPLNAVADNNYTRSLATIGSLVPRPTAIMVVSAHWLTDGPRVSCSRRPRLIHDFYGFPRRLYELDYPCPGAPEAARATMIAAGQAAVTCDDSWGIDHAAWAVLRHIYPAADIPVFELSLDIRREAAFHYDLGRRLLPLRDEGIFIVGSGNIVHNLMLADFADMEARPYPWAVDFDLAVKDCLLQSDHERLVDYASLPGASLAVPTNEHYLPLLYVCGLQAAGDHIHFVHEGSQNASVSMRTFLIGMPPR